MVINPIGTNRAVPSVVMLYHDDWLVNVLLSNGRTYCFITELWPEHLDGPPAADGESETNWPAVTQAAASRALFLDSLDVDTLDFEVLPRDLNEFRALLNDRCMHMTDTDFRRFTQS